MQSKQDEGGTRRCLSYGGGIGLRCELHESHVGNHKIFSKEDGSVIAEWDWAITENGESPFEEEIK